ncbi:NgoMIV family type II restriction endonuclease [Nocardiopsis sp. CNS-639]|uniref:NgoMIV family type II restriction endonuclease n=1 Tax=Nocardiopsis sp. CNS-639 TaxID=1169153 RepID=UPI0009DB7B1C|nr:NgoMIV family type II restriction endonuclease [Nocardiopsis sp. CNS-639]
MTSPFAHKLLGWRKPSEKSQYVPNCADSDNAQSIQISNGMLYALGLSPENHSKPPKNPGSDLEDFVRDNISTSLAEDKVKRTWVVEKGRIVTEFAQYAHLKRVNELVKNNPELRVTIGQDYLIKPDVTVGITDLDTMGEHPFLHAAISCKWTIRSDRVQNIRHEFNQMIRHRRGRQPHLVTVTAEPLPSRLASITRGTGEVDAVYHVAFDALKESVDKYANSPQKEAWEECVEQKRLLSYESLAKTLAKW